MTVNSSSKIKLQSHLLALSPILSQQQIKEIQPENYFLNKLFPLGDITPIKKKKKQGFTDDKYIGLSGTVIPFHLLHLPSGGVLLCKLPYSLGSVVRIHMLLPAREEIECKKNKCLKTLIVI